MSAQRTYELVYIIAPETSEEAVNAIHAQVEAIVQRFSGTIASTENWGRKKLAYEIGRYKEGIYLLDVMQGPADMIRELDRRLKVTDAVFRHLVVRIDEDMQVAERRRSERLANQARRREARGLPPLEATPEPAATADGVADHDELGHSRQAEG